MSERMQMVGNVGCYLDDNNVISFQIGADPLGSSVMDEDEGFSSSPSINHFGEIQWLHIRGYNVAARGWNNRQCEEIERDIKDNRLLPRLINKQSNMLYGSGPAVYRPALKNGKKIREWVEQPAIQEWLENWLDNGMEMSYRDFALAVIKAYYYYRDYFVKWRIAYGKAIGKYPIAGLELMEHKLCRLATDKKDIITENIYYKDFRYILVGNWQYGAAKFQVYPKFDIRDVNNYRYAAISHHREKSIGDFYGCNETHQGTKGYIKGSNQTADYINSFLKNSLAAKVHVIIPSAWVESKRKQIKAICDENKLRQKDNKDLLLYNGIDIGTTFKESSLIQYISHELRKLSKYLSGSGNQGKAFSSISFRTGNNSEEERWKIETVDLKYKEYISSLIEYDKRADEVLVSSVGMDSSISSISKDGVISKSGSDVYYNYLIYSLTLTPDDEKCAEPFNMAIKINFPELYREGYRIGFYRDIPSRQEEVSEKDRLKNQQS